MPVRKMRVEVYDESGNRYSISLDGKVTRKNALRVLDMVELLGGMPELGPESQSNEELPKIEKVRFVVERDFPLVWFTPKDVQVAYEREANESVGSSTISTYLSRLSDKGVLIKAKDSNKVRYRVMSSGLSRLIGTQ